MGLQVNALANMTTCVRFLGPTWGKNRTDAPVGCSLTSISMLQPPTHTHKLNKIERKEHK